MCEELIHDGLLIHRRQDYVSLSPDGWDKAKELIDPGANISNQEITIQTAINSPVQQGSGSSIHQSTNYHNVSNNDLARLVDIFDKHINELNLEEPAKRKAEAQVNTIKAQLMDEPDPLIITQAGKTLRNITEGAIASLVATASQPTVWSIVHRIFTAFS